MTSPARVWAVVGGLLLVCFAAAAWFLVLSPRIASSSQVAAQTSQVEKATFQLNVRYRQALTEAAQAPQAAAEAQQLFSSMPQEAELPDVLEQITTAADSAGITGTHLQVINTSVPTPVGAKGSAINPMTAAAKGAGVNLATMEVSITADGDRTSLAQFLANLERLERALLISSTHVADTSPGNLPTLQVAGSMFVLQSELPDLVARLDELMARARAGTGTLPAPADGTDSGVQSSAPASGDASTASTTPSADEQRGQPGSELHGRAQRRAAELDHRQRGEQPLTVGGAQPFGQ